jgi:hypothetical protein
MMPHPDFLPETPIMYVNKHFALSSELISELLLEMRLRGVQYRRLQTGSEFGVGLATDRDMPIFITSLWALLCFVRATGRCTN